MKILVTGGKGYIGSYLVPLLEKKGYKAISWDINEGEDIFSDLFEDILKDCNIVIHLAALTSVQDSLLHPQEFFKVNIQGTARVAALCAKYHIKLIFASTSAVYDPNSSPYAFSKGVAEEIIKYLGEINQYVIFRFFNIYGIPPKKGTILYYFLHNSPLIIYNEGKQTRDFIRVEDVCNIIIDSFSDKYNNLTIDVGMGKEVMVNQVAKLFVEYHHKKIKDGGKRQELLHSVADIKLLHKLYKGGLFTNLEEDIEQMKI